MLPTRPILVAVAVLALVAPAPVAAFDEAELDVFDLVEEVNTLGVNFYEYLEVANDATTAQIKKAYRGLSLKLHPDKNDADDAEVS